jgi:predicted peroxiredoxin
MKDEKMILYVQTSDQPERQYTPLVLAQTAKAMDLRPAVYYLGQGLKILKPGEAEKIKLGTFPSVMEMLKVKIVGAATLNDLALDAGATMWF